MLRPRKRTIKEKIPDEGEEEPEYFTNSSTPSSGPSAHLLPEGEKELTVSQAWFLPMQLGVRTNRSACALWPFRFRRQGGQDRLDIAAGPEAELGAAII